MKITKIHIENFRALLNTTIDVEEMLSIIVGKNNTGKTSLKLLLDKFLVRDSANFCRNDLNCNLQSKLLTQIEADKGKNNDEILLAGVPEFAIKLFLHISYSKDDNLSNISTLITDLDMNLTEVVIGFAYRLDAESYLKLLGEYKAKKAQFEKIKETKPTLVVPDVWHLLKNDTIGGYFKNIIFVAEKTTNEAEAYILPSADKLIEVKRATVQQIINYKYISAERDSLNPNVNQSESSTLSALAAKHWDITRKSKSDDEIAKSEQELEAQFILADAEFTGIYSGVFQSVLDDIKRISDSKDKLTIESSFQARNLLQQNATVKYEHDTTRLPEDYNGLGYMNLIEIVFRLKLIKREFEDYNDGQGADINLLFIEEPEAHMHPQMQVIFIRHITELLILKNASKVQTLLSTHSSHIAANTDMDAFKYFVNTDNGVKVKNLKDLKPQKLVETATTEEKNLSAAEFATYRFVKQYITLNRAEVFFADKIIIIEGDTERILLPSMMQKLDAVYKDNPEYFPLLSQNISVIEAGAYAKEFDGLIKFLEIATLIITDIDYVKADRTKTDSATADATSNATINYYLRGKSIADIKTADQVTRTAGKILLAYQQTENGYQARSFEDAFIAINHEWLKQHKDAMHERSALKNLATLTMEVDYMNISEKCIESKTAFAVSIIYESQRNEHDGDTWQTPKYIQEGLLWLSK